jgi:hypothetical protein
MNRAGANEMFAFLIFIAAAFGAAGFITLGCLLATLSNLESEVSFPVAQVVFEGMWAAYLVLIGAACMLWLTTEW